MARSGWLGVLLLAAQGAAGQGESAQPAKPGDVGLHVAIVQGAMRVAAAQMGRIRPALLDSLSFARALGVSKPAEVAAQHGESAAVAARSSAIRCSRSGRECTIDDDRVILQLSRISVTRDSAVANVVVEWADRAQNRSGAAITVMVHAALEVKLVQRGGAWQVVSTRVLSIAE